MFQPFRAVGRGTTLSSCSSNPWVICQVSSFSSCCPSHEPGPTICCCSSCLHLLLQGLLQVFQRTLMTLCLQSVQWWPWWMDLLWHQLILLALLNIMVQKKIIQRKKKLNIQLFAAFVMMFWFKVEWKLRLLLVVMCSTVNAWLNVVMLVVLLEHGHLKGTYDHHGY